MCSARLLIVEDDAVVQRELRSQLCDRGFEVQVAGSGPAALDAVLLQEPQLVLLDIGLPGMGGLEVCRRIREWSAVPIICVSALDGVQTKTAALKLGADDYITKPFHTGELVARIRAVLRRAAGGNALSRPTVELGEIRIDLAHHEVLRHGSPIHLTQTEFALLREFAVNPDRVLSYDQLFDAVWGAGSSDPHLVQVHVCQLRSKIQLGPESPRYIQAMAGVGYILRSDAA